MTSSSKFLKSGTQADFHRKRMGLNQKFKSTKNKKEKHFNHSSLEERVIL